MPALFALYSRALSLVLIGLSSSDIDIVIYNKCCPYTYTSFSLIAAVSSLSHDSAVSIEICVGTLALFAVAQDITEYFRLVSPKWIPYRAKVSRISRLIVLFSLRRYTFSISLCVPYFDIRSLSRSLALCVGVLHSLCRGSI